jgi:hypothetical protein
MFLAVLGLVAIFYFGIAILVARLCSINSRWERLAERIPAPRLASGRTASVVIAGDDDLLDEPKEAAPPAS